MNYEEMKPWQICQLVHNHAVCNGEFEVTFENNGCQWKYKDQSQSSEVFEFTMNESKGRVKGYTSEIEHAWPIIKENKISIITVGAEWEAHRFSDLILDEEFNTTNKDPLVAAMICFLKMKDAENGNN